MKRPSFTAPLDAAHRLLEREQAIYLELPSSGRLVEAGSDGESGLGSAAGVLCSAPRLPDALVLRLAVPDPWVATSVGSTQEGGVHTADRGPESAALLARSPDLAR